MPANLAGMGRGKAWGVSKLGSRCGPILVDQAAKQIVAFDLRVGTSGCVSRLGRDKRECSMRPLRVVVGRVRTEHVFEVAAAGDQQPVETLGAHRTDEAFGAGVRLPPGPACGSRGFLRYGRPRRTRHRTCCRGRGSVTGSARRRRWSRGCVPAGWPSRRSGWSCSLRGGRGGFRARWRRGHSRGATWSSRP